MRSTRTCATGSPPNGDGVRLKCEPEHEAQTFEQSGDNGTWERLPTVEVPTVVIAGRRRGRPTVRGAAAAAEQLPHGRYVEVADLDHFGPFTHPARVAALVAAPS